MNLCRLLLACLIAIPLAAACTSNLTAEEYIDRAEDFIDEGNQKAAEIELKNALLQNPDNARARWLLGNLYFESGNLSAAEKELLKARSLGVSDESVLPIIARTYYYQGKYDEVLRLESSGLATDALAELVALQGAALISTNRLDEATKRINTALSQNPESIEARTQEARLALAKGDKDTAREHLDRLLSQTDYAPAWLSLIHI